MADWWNNQQWNWDVEQGGQGGMSQWEQWYQEECHRDVAARAAASAAQGAPYAGQAPQAHQPSGPNNKSGGCGLVFWLVAAMLLAACGGTVLYVKGPSKMGGPPKKIQKRQTGNKNATIKKKDNTKEQRENKYQVVSRRSGGQQKKAGGPINVEQQKEPLPDAELAQKINETYRRDGCVDEPEECMKELEALENANPGHTELFVDVKSEVLPHLIKKTLEHGQCQEDAETCMEILTDLENANQGHAHLFADAKNEVQNKILGGHLKPLWDVMAKIATKQETHKVETSDLAYRAAKAGFPKELTFTILENAKQKSGDLAAFYNELNANITTKITETHLEGVTGVLNDMFVQAVPLSTKESTTDSKELMDDQEKELTDAQNHVPCQENLKLLMSVVQDIAAAAEAKARPSSAEAKAHSWGRAPHTVETDQVEKNADKYGFPAAITFEALRDAKNKTSTEDPAEFYKHLNADNCITDFVTEKNKEDGTPQLTESTVVERLLSFLQYFRTLDGALALLPELHQTYLTWELDSYTHDDRKKPFEESLRDKSYWPDERNFNWEMTVGQLLDFKDFKLDTDADDFAAHINKEIFPRVSRKLCQVLGSRTSNFDTSKIAEKYDFDESLLRSWQDLKNKWEAPQCMWKTPKWNNSSPLEDLKKNKSADAQINNLLKFLRDALRDAKPAGKIEHKEDLDDLMLPLNQSVRESVVALKNLEVELRDFDQAKIATKYDFEPSLWESLLESDNRVMKTSADSKKLLMFLQDALYHAKKGDEELIYPGEKWNYYHNKWENSIPKTVNHSKWLTDLRLKSKKP